MGKKRSNKHVPAIQAPKPVAPPVASWARFAALVSAAVGSLIPRDFSTILSAGILLILAVDLGCFEPWFKAHSRIKWTAIVLIVAVVGSFTVNFLRPAPLSIESHIANPEHDYRPGTSFAGIAWKPGFSDLRVNIHNPSAFDYDSVALLISTDQAVVQVGQLQVGSPVCALSPNSPIADAHVNFKEADSGNEYTIPQLISPSVSMDSKYKLTCDKLPRGATVRLTLATANMGDPGTLILPIQGEEKYGPTRHPRSVHMSGNYKANDRSRTIEYACKVGEASCQ